MDIKFHKKYSSRNASSLQDAFEKGLFNGSISRDELMARITKYNPDVRWIAHEHVMGLHDVHKGFVCGITRSRTIPLFSIFLKNPNDIKKIDYCTEEGEYTHSGYVDKNPESGKMLARGWAITFHILEQKGYKIDRVGLPDSYFWEWKWKEE